MGEVLPFRRKTQAPFGPIYEYPVGCRETMTVLYHAKYGWSGCLTLANGDVIGLNHWAGNMTEVKDALIELYIQQEISC